MQEVTIRFPRDEDGALAALEFTTEDAAQVAAAPLEIALLHEHDDPGRDPVLALAREGQTRPFFRSDPLPGPLFAKLREVWESRRAEGFRVEVRGGAGAPEEVGVASWALDFGGHLARGRALEVAGELEQALAAYQASASPTRDAEIRRVQEALGQTVPPPPAEGALDDETVVLEIIRAIAADGKVDAQEVRVLQALAASFRLAPEKLKQLIDKVKAEPRPADGKPLVPEEVLRSLVQRAAAAGRIGPGSSQALKRAAKALGLSVEQVRQIVAG